MPAPLNVDRTAVKAFARVHGVAAAARQFGLAAGTVRSWSCRDPLGPWGTEPKPAALAACVQAALSALDQAATSPDQAAQNPLPSAEALEEIRRRSQFALAQGLEKGAQAIGAMSGREVLAGLRQVKTLAWALRLTHGRNAGPPPDPPEAGFPLINLEILDLHVPPLKTVPEQPAAPENGTEEEMKATLPALTFMSPRLPQAEAEMESVGEGCWKEEDRLKGDVY